MGNRAKGHERELKIYGLINRNCELGREVVLNCY